MVAPVRPIAPRAWGSGSALVGVSLITWLIRAATNCALQVVCVVRSRSPKQPEGMMLTPNLVVPGTRVRGRDPRRAQSAAGLLRGRQLGRQTEEAF